MMVNALVAILAMAVLVSVTGWRGFFWLLGFVIIGAVVVLVWESCTLD